MTYKNGRRKGNTKKRTRIARGNSFNENTYNPDGGIDYDIIDKDGDSWRDSVVIGLLIGTVMGSLALGVWGK